MQDEPEYNALDPELEERMRKKRADSRAQRERSGAAAIPRRFADFELLELLGEGPAARVFRARGPGGEIVALKCIRDAVVAGVERKGARARFLDSIRDGLLQTRHPHLLRVLDVVRDGESLALVLELREEESLDALLRRRPALPWRECVRIALTLCDALAALPFAHDDVKARNVLVGEGGTVLLMDPGSAREIDLEAGDRAIALSGSPQFMAPERLRGAEASEAVDVYALGCLCQLMLTGRLPVKGPLVEQLRAAHARSERAELRSPLGNVPASLRELVGRMLAAEAEDRPSLVELREALAQVADDESAEPKAPGRRRLLWFAAAAILFLVLLIWRGR